MNNMEYYSANHRNEYHRYIHKLLNEWKLANSIIERCVVHHRDDTEECRKYNEEHYELWGFNLDGTFEYGKYIVFMTMSEHMQYHNAGANNPMYGVRKFGVDNPFYGRTHSHESKEKMRIAHTGKKLSHEHRSKMAATRKGIGILWKVYKNNNGVLSYNDFRRALKNGYITFAPQSITILTK